MTQQFNFSFSGACTSNLLTFQNIFKMRFKLKGAYAAPVSQNTAPAKTAPAKTAPGAVYTDTTPVVRARTHAYSLLVLTTY
jgi:hypothetical protein